jgi:hypothetical protein
VQVLAREPYAVLDAGTISFPQLAGKGPTEASHE